MQTGRVWVCCKKEGQRESKEATRRRKRKVKSGFR
jgi:hypothetical protein